MILSLRRHEHKADQVLVKGLKNRIQHIADAPDAAPVRSRNPAGGIGVRAQYSHDLPQRVHKDTGIQHPHCPAPQEQRHAAQEKGDPAKNAGSPMVPPYSLPVQ